LQTPSLCLGKVICDDRRQNIEAVRNLQTAEKIKKIYLPLQKSNERISMMGLREFHLFVHS